MKTPAAPSATALPTFMGRIDRSRKILAAIEAHLEDHLGVSPEEVTWAHAGDAARLLEKLEDIAQTFRLATK